VNAIATIYVNQHLDSLRAERSRSASLAPTRSLRSRISAAAASLGIVASNSGPVLPKLQNYPYEG